MEYIIAAYLAVVNVLGFALMGIDKGKAISRSFRIRERTLFLVAIIGGSLGSILGMEVFRHKTKHMTFKIGMPLIFFFQVILGIIIVLY